MKRVLLIVHVYPPEVASAGFMAQELAYELAAKGHSVTIITGWPSHPAGRLFNGWKSALRHVVVKDDVKIIRSGHLFGNRKNLLFRFFYYFTFAISSFINGLFSGKQDVVICLSTPFFGSWSSWLLARMKSAKFIYDIFDLHPEAALNSGMVSKKSIIYKIWYWQDKLLCNLSDLIITLSEPLKNEIVKRAIDPLKVKVIPFWIDEKRITPGNRINKWRKLHNIENDKFVVLYAGTLGFISGVDIIVDTAKIVESDTRILILIVGEGAVKENLQNMTIAKGCTNIKFLPFQLEEDLNDMQATADVGLITSLPQAGQTSIPSKILGYLAAERPVIASVSLESGTASLINSGECGLIAKCQDANELANKILFAANNADVIGKMGKNGRALVMSAFSKTACTNQYNDIIESEI